MAKNRRLVTVVGGSGFIGSYVVRQLANEGYTLRVLCRDSVAARKLCTLGDVGQIVPEYFDLAKPGDIAARLAGSFAVINLVGVLFEKGRQKFASLHAQGAEKLAQAATQAGVERFVQFSALGVEKAAKSNYARTKQQGEKAVLAAFPNATILRPSVVFGREDNFFNQFASMSRTGFLPIIGGGRTKFQPIYVCDVADATSAALKKPEAMGRIFELGGPEVISMRGIYDYIGRVTGRDIHYVDLPFAVAGIASRVTQWLPKPPLTGDQVRLLKYDSVVDKSALTLRDLGVSPTAIELIVPEYIARYSPRTFSAV